jgi:two-component system chemotaxis sensor kinase CheA
MGARLITALNGYLAPKPSLPPPEEPALPELDDAWGIQIAYGIDVFRDGMDPASQISYLSKLGSLDAIRPRFRWPENFEPEDCYLNLSLVLVTDANKQTIEDVSWNTRAWSNRCANEWFETER